MKIFMNLITAIALFAVQPNVSNVGTIADTPMMSSAVALNDVGVGNDADSDDAPTRPTGQMPEIEVEQYGGELLHVTSMKLFEPVITGTIEVLPVLDPNEHTSFPLLRPPRA